MNANTPKKKVVRKGRGRKPNLEVEASDFCRICKVNFKKNGTYISSENLFTTSKPGGPLSEILSSKLKLFLTCASNLSSRVCAKCALKIRNASSNFILVEENLNVPHHNFQESAVEENDDTERFKRCSSRLSPVPLSVNSLSPVLPSLDVTDRRGTARSLEHGLVGLFLSLSW